MKELILHTRHRGHYQKSVFMLGVIYW